MCGVHRRNASLERGKDLVEFELPGQQKAGRDVTFQCVPTFKIQPGYQGCLKHSKTQAKKYYIGEELLWYGIRYYVEGERRWENCTVGELVVL